MRASTTRLIAILVLAAALPAILLFGCRVMQKLSGSSGPRFNHAFHVKEKKLACDTCHPEALTGDRAGMPTYDENCAPCHEDADKNKPEAERASALFPGGRLAWKDVTRISPEVKFSHKAHADKNVKCEECHRGIDEATRVTPALAVGKWQCMDCHASRGASNDCATCHSAIRKETPPETHRLNWERLHGQASRSGHEAKKYCGLCHLDENCLHCHQEQMPRNHTNYFRIRGHGQIAMMDRDACRACHRVDYCDRCHSSTPPRSHIGTWGGTTDRHCLACHLPLNANEQCSVCHKATPSHREAPPKPASPPHTPFMNCRQCHVPGSAILHHADNGTNCNSCHL